MQFWIRHVILLIACLVLPSGLGLWFDTKSEVERAQTAASRASKLASKSLDARIRLKAHHAVSDAISLARSVSDAEVHLELGREGPRGEAAMARLGELAQKALPAGGFVLYAGAEGQVAYETRPSGGKTQRSLSGHPLFLETQQGFAVDGMWVENGVLHLVATAPVTQSGAASGAILVAAPVGREMLASLGEGIGAEITLARGEEVVASTVEEAVARPLVAAVKTMGDPMPGGSLDTPLAHPYLPLLPIFIDRRAEGVAFASVGGEIPGAIDYRWIVSAPTAEWLQEIVRRQEMILGVLAATLMLAFLIGLMNSRTLVRPIARLEAHLSQLQQGRGDLELSEKSVSHPFRRLVRLINMTVQRLPSRTLSALAPSPVPELGTSSPFFDQVDPEDGVPVEDMSTPGSPLSGAALGAGGFRAGDSQDVGLAMDEMLATLSSQASITPTAEPDADHGEAIANAIASLQSSDLRLEGPENPWPDLAPASSAPKSASEIRGRPMSGAPAAGVRGGGSLRVGELGGAVSEDFSPESTVVSPVAEDLLAKSAGRAPSEAGEKQVRTVVGSVSPDVLAQASGDGDDEGADGDQNGLDEADRTHFREVYERFLDMRKKCGEDISDLAFERFYAKLTKNRENLIRKYSCRTVRFQVYEKDGKAALKATPVRAR